MPRKKPPKPKLVLLAERIADAKRIIDAQQMLLEKLRVPGVPTREDEGTLRTYITSLTHLLVHERREKEAEVNKAEAKLKGGRNKKISEPQTS
jgi:hypothetical protein